MCLQGRCRDVRIACNTRCLEHLQEGQRNSRSTVAPPSPDFTLTKLCGPGQCVFRPIGSFCMRHQPVSSSPGGQCRIRIVETRGPFREKIYLARNTMGKAQVTAS